MRDTPQILTVWCGGSMELRDSETGALTSAAVAGVRLTRVWLSPDERRLLTIDETGITRIQTVTPGTPSTSLAPLDDAVVAVHWAPDGSRVLVVSASGRTVVSDATSGAFIAERKPRRPPQPGTTPAAAWSPDGTRFLTCEEFSQIEGIDVWDAATGEALGSSPAPNLSPLWNAVWSPDGRWIVSVAEAIRVIEPGTGRIVRVLSSSEDLECPVLSLSPEGARAVIGLPSGVAEIWDLESGSEPLLLRGHEGRVHRGVWSADGAQVLTISEDATARVWNTTDGGLLCHTSH